MDKLDIQFIALGLALLMVSCVSSTYNIGRTLLQARQYEEAVAHFLSATKTDSSSYKNWRELGIAYYHVGKSDSAFLSFRKANQLNPDDSKTILCKNTLIREEIRSAIENEPTKTPDSTIAVLYFDNASGKTELEPLRKGLAEMVSNALSQVEALRVLERIRLEILIQELKLSEKLRLQIQEPPRIGKLLGAGTLVIGNFTELNDNDIRVDISLVKTKTAEIQAFEHVRGSKDDLSSIVGNLALKIIDELDIVLTVEERRDLYEVPAENLFVFLERSRKIRADDKEMIGQLRKAGSLESIIENATSERLQASGAQVHAGIIPGQDERDSVQEASGTEGFQGVPVDLEIIIPPSLNQ